MKAEDGCSVHLARLHRPPAVLMVDLYALGAMSPHVDRLTLLITLELLSYWKLELNISPSLWSHFLVWHCCRLSHRVHFDFDFREPITFSHELTAQSHISLRARASGTGQYSCPTALGATWGCLETFKHSASYARSIY